MELLDVITYPNEILKKKARIVNNINSDLQKIIVNMTHTMHKAQGMGLAAPQVGIASRIIIYNTNTEGRKKTFNVLINPKIVDMNKKIISENEGCLSIPGLRSNVKRFDEVLVEGIDKNEKQLHVEAKGILSIILQHEIDHLNGILLIDYLSPLKRHIYKKHILKQIRTQRQ